jgi:hypothetical protein
MGTWAGLVYNNGLIRCANTDWLEIDKLNLGDPEILEVNNGAIVSPTKSFIQLEWGTVPHVSQCDDIGISGLASGTILIVRGLSSSAVSLVDNGQNVHVESLFSLSTYNTMVLIKTNFGWSEIARSAK